MGFLEIWGVKDPGDKTPTERGLTHLSEIHRKDRKEYNPIFDSWGNEKQSQSLYLCGFETVFHFYVKCVMISKGSLACGEPLN